jgi:hypothetical protein
MHNGALYPYELRLGGLDPAPTFDDAGSYTNIWLFVGSTDLRLFQDKVTVICPNAHCARYSDPHDIVCVSLLLKNKSFTSAKWPAATWRVWAGSCHRGCGMRSFVVLVTEGADKTSFRDIAKETVCLLGWRAEAEFTRWRFHNVVEGNL